MRNYKPILFSTPMVKAILEGRKTETRRIMWNDRTKYTVGDILWVRETWRIIGWNDGDPFTIQFKDGKIKRDVYLDESKAENYLIQCTNQCLDSGLNSDDKAFFHFDLDNCPTKWRPSIFMPKEACRIFLKLTDIRIERLHDISEQDAIAEGVESQYFKEFKTTGYKIYSSKLDSWDANPIVSYSSLWDKINGNKAWDLNPYVWVYTFEKTEVDINEFLKK